MTTTKNLIAGLGGALVLNIIHESLKRANSDTPRIDLLGEEALQKGLNYLGTEIKDKDVLYGATLGGDLISNAMYYSLIGVGDQKYLWPKAIALGIAAGVGAIELPEPMGLDAELVAKNNKTKALTVGYYLIGALATAGILKCFSSLKFK